jgi:hypothetical protein
LDRDAFTKRETAAEELYIRQEEKAKYVYDPIDNGYTTSTIRNCHKRIGMEERNGIC